MDASRETEAGLRTKEVYRVQHRIEEHHPREMETMASINNNLSCGSLTKKGWTGTRPFVGVTLLNETLRALIESRTMVKLIGDRLVGLLDSQGIRPEGEAVELRMADGFTSQCRNRYRLNGLMDSRTHS